MNRQTKWYPVILNAADIRAIFDDPQDEIGQSPDIIGESRPETRNHEYPNQMKILSFPKESLNNERKSSQLPTVDNSDFVNLGFWQAQIAGWLVYFLLHILSSLVDGNSSYLTGSIVSALTGFVATSAMRQILHNTWQPNGIMSLLSIFSIAFVFAIPYSIINEQVYWLNKLGTFDLRTPIEYLGNTLWCGSILLTWSGIYFGLRYYTEANQQKINAADALAQARKARIEILRDRLNPHFLFNTLNGISTLVLAEENKKAVKMIDQMCSLFRKTLDMPQGLIPFSQELELLKLYLEIQHIRFDERLDVTWNISQKTLSALVPSMYLQPIVENSIQYAVEPNLDGAKIRIDADVIEGNLVTKIQDTGSSIQSSNSEIGHGEGHRNLKERLAVLYGRDAEFTAIEKSDGYVVEIKFPVKR